MEGSIPVGSSGDAGDWRSSVLQSQRNIQVRQIAQVLASLEQQPPVVAGSSGGSSTTTVVTANSKLRLAMQFEDSVFKQAESYADYQKRITKRLRKVQKSYVPPAAAATTTSTSSSSSTTLGGGGDPKSGTTPSGGAGSSSTGTGTRFTRQQQQHRKKVLFQLQQTYGETIWYILCHGNVAFMEMKNKLGDEKAIQLKQHIDMVYLWASDLGIVIPNSMKPTKTTSSSINNNNNSTKPTTISSSSSVSSSSIIETTISNTPTGSSSPPTIVVRSPLVFGPPNYTISEEQLEKLKNHLEKRLDNIRSHVVKLADPDLFMMETLTKLENDWRYSLSILSTTSTSSSPLSSSSAIGQQPQSQQPQPHSSNSTRTRASEYLSNCMKRRYAQLQQKTNMVPVVGPTATTLATLSSSSTSSTTSMDNNKNNNTEMDPLDLLMTSLEQIQASNNVTISTRRNTSNSNNQDIQQEQKRFGLIQLDRIKAASTLLFAFLTISEKSLIPTNTNHILSRAHGVATDAIRQVVDLVRKQRQETHEPIVSLQDAWMKSLIWPNSSSNMNTNTMELDLMNTTTTTTLTTDDKNDINIVPLGEDPNLEPPNKRLKTSSSTSSSSVVVSTTPGIKKGLTHSRLVLRSKVLLTAGRKVPSNLLLALRRKRVQLVCSPTTTRRISLNNNTTNTNNGSHLILKFHEAFVMTIYLVPLLVTIRAYDHHRRRHTKNSNNNIHDGMSLSSPKRRLNQCSQWTPWHTGLTHRGSQHHHQQRQQKAPQQKQQQPQQPNEDMSLTVWGAKGDYASLGLVVQERLRDASARATHVLRQCFTSTVRENSEGFECEIMEATALLEFVQLVRTTYIPNWQDEDI